MCDKVYYISVKGRSVFIRHHEFEANKINRISILKSGDLEVDTYKKNLDLHEIRLQTQQVIEKLEYDKKNK